MNFQKQSTEKLEALLDSLYDKGLENSKDAQEIDAELNARASKSTQIKLDKEAAKAAEAARIQQLFDDLAETHSKRIRMKAMVQEFGGEFEGDYKVDFEKLTIESFSYNSRNPNAQKFWEHKSVADTKKHLHELVYWRVYDHYFRTDIKESDILRLKNAMNLILMNK